MARKGKNIHYIYKTTCNVTGKYYIGMHSTHNLDDGYMGSGKRLRYSIRKHGVENHTKEILEFLPTREELVLREIEIVNSELIKDALCMNLKEGGSGGFSSEEHKLKFIMIGSKAGTDALRDKHNDFDFNKKWCEVRKLAWLNLSDEKRNQLLNHLDWTGRNHSDETKNKMSEIMKTKGKGSSNSQYGKCWITNEIESKKIMKGDLIPEGWRLGRKMK
jgi:hypothetical protein